MHDVLAIEYSCTFLWDSEASYHGKMLNCDHQNIPQKLISHTVLPLYYAPLYYADLCITRFSSRF